VLLLSLFVRLNALERLLIQCTLCNAVLSPFWKFVVGLKLKFGNTAGIGTPNATLIRNTPIQTKMSFVATFIFENNLQSFHDTTARKEIHNPFMEHISLQCNNEKLEIHVLETRHVISVSN